MQDAGRAGQIADVVREEGHLRVKGLSEPFPLDGGRVGMGVEAVGADGSVDLCCAYKGIKEWSIGNINDKNFEDIWNNEKMKELLKNIDICKCPPMCKADEINRLINFIEEFDANKEFV